MRAVILGSLVLFVVFAGCIGGDDPLVTTPETPELDPFAATGAARLLPVASFEPTIGVTSSGALFMTGGNTSAGTTHQTLFRSYDHGATWEDVTANLLGVTNYPPNSNDPYVFVDKDTDRVFDFEMQGLSCNMLAYSDDEAESWEARPLGCTPTQVIQDHQTIFTAHPRAVGGVTPPVTGYSKILYYCVNRVIDSGCSASYDSGLTWGPFRPFVYSGIDPTQQFNPNNVVGFGLLCGGLHAHGAAHPDGTIYLPRGYCGVPTVAISDDNGLTWDLVEIAPDHRMFASSHETSIGVDDDGNVFASWLGDDRKVYLAASTDRGYTWGEPTDITGEGVTMAYFPVVTAAGSGNVAIAYVGTTAPADLAFGELEAEHAWNGYITVGYGLAGEAGNATFRTVQTNEDGDPIARGVCAPGRCQAGRGGLGDFIDIEIDVEGRPWAAFVDVCHKECIEDEGGQHDFALGMVGTLATGKPLRGDAMTLPPLRERA